MRWVAAVLMILAASAQSSWAQGGPLDKALMDAELPAAKAVVPWLIGLLLVGLACMALFKKSKRAGYQER